MDILIKKVFTNIHSKIDKEMFFLSIYKMYEYSDQEIDLFSFVGINDNILNSLLDLPIIEIKGISLVEFEEKIEYHLVKVDDLKIKYDVNALDAETREYFNIYNTALNSILFFFILKINDKYYFSRFKKNYFNNADIVSLPIKDFTKLYRKNILESIFDDL
jgi:hypothetical protein